MALRASLILRAPDTLPWAWAQARWAWAVFSRPGVGSLDSAHCPDCCRAYT